MVHLTSVKQLQYSHRHWKQFASAPAKIWAHTVRIPNLKGPGTTVMVNAVRDDVNKAAGMIATLLQQHKGRTLVITGAGISTDSGIPDYRGEQGTYVKNPRHRPILYHELVSSESFLQCYWARGFMGWPAMRKARPNTAHYVLSELMETDYVSHIITQNVDNLHRDASSVDHDRIIELHGSLYQVECLACGSTIDRDTFQQGLEAINPTWTSFMLEKPEINPDGDAKLPGALCYKDFNIFPCTTCSSRRMKPTVVFFGENIPKRVADAAEQAVRQSNAVLVLASSLATYSSFRLVRLAKDLGLPIGILCKGPTRADSLASWKIEMECSPVLQQIQFMLLAR